MVVPATLSYCAAATYGFQFCAFVLAYALQTETFYDVCGGAAFLLLGFWSFLVSEGSQLSWVATALFVVSRLWLLLFLGWRAHERKGDARFDGVKERAGVFLFYWMVQATWVYLVSLPIIYINHHAKATDVLSVYEIVCLAVFAAAVFIEVVADIQKTVWIRRGRIGGFCAVGLWSFSRHPNYFGEILQWWASFAMMVPLLLSTNPSAFSGWVCLLSPIFTCWILMFTSGTGLMDAEGRGLKRFMYEDPAVAEEYRSYREQTSILIPMVGYSNIPMVIKRTFFFEWELYEYRPSLSSQEKKESESIESGSTPHTE